MKKLILLLAILAVGCTKEEDPAITVPVVPVVMDNFLERYEGRYGDSEVGFVIEFEDSEYNIYVQNELFIPLGCFDYFNLVTDDDNFSIVNHSPEEFKYRIQTNDSVHRIQTITKTDFGISRYREFFRSDVIDTLYTQDIPTFLGASPVVCDFEAEYREDPNYSDLNFDIPRDYYTAFKRDKDDAGNTVADPTTIVIEILDDEEYETESAARATICDAGLNVEIRKGWWDDASIPNRMSVMYHEFGHGVFNYDHVCSPSDIMFTGAEAHIEKCGGADSLVRPQDLNEYTDYYSGFKVAISRLFSGENQVVDDRCESGKGTTVIEDVFPTNNIKN